MGLSLKFGHQIMSVEKIRDEDFTPLHHEILSQMQYQQDMLIFPDDRWQARYLGRGEEKAVFCVCDHNQRVFAVELIDERHYLNGRFATGQYFFNMRIPALTGLKAQSDSEFGLTFTGLIKVREFVHGHVWARFQFDPHKKSALDGLLTSLLQSVYRAQFQEYRSRYKDVHEWNVAFEIRSREQPGFPLLIRTETGRLALVKIGLQPIDVR
jgi:hypothetical protein